MALTLQRQRQKDPEFTRQACLTRNKPTRWGVTSEQEAGGGGRAWGGRGGSAEGRREGSQWFWLIQGLGEFLGGGTFSLKTKAVPGKPGQWPLCKDVGGWTQNRGVSQLAVSFPVRLPSCRFMTRKLTEMETPGPLPDVLNQICTFTRSLGHLVHFGKDWPCFELVRVSPLREIAGCRKDLFGLTSSEASVRDQPVPFFFDLG